MASSHETNASIWSRKNSDTTPHPAFLADKQPETNAKKSTIGPATAPPWRQNGSRPWQVNRGKVSGGNFDRNGSNLANKNSSISSQGFRQARGEIGRKPGEMEMLQSPSRGLEEDETQTLKNPTMQEKYRVHIMNKLERHAAEFPHETNENSARKSKRQQELSIILLDLRKLREGLTSIRRVDKFCIQVYELSVNVAIQAENWQQLSACLPHLVLDLYPIQAKTALESSLGRLSLSSSNLAQIVEGNAAEYTLLYCLHSISHHYLDSLAEIPKFLSGSPAALPASFCKLVQALHQALLYSNYHLYASILYPPKSSGSAEPVPNLAPLTENGRTILNGAGGATERIREAAWIRIEKSYKMAIDFENFEWLAKILCFSRQELDQARNFVDRKRGKTVSA